VLQVLQECDMLQYCHEHDLVLKHEDSGVKRRSAEAIAVLEANQEYKHEDSGAKRRSAEAIAVLEANQEYNKCVTRVLQELQECYRIVTRVLQGTGRSRAKVERGQGA
jgi:hypothetical protein